ncbi:hypothetical protein WN55_02016 [Dufourea novaeangliae]|uniref:Uncharacterized protein n=1 Tax=Dufourea novaeangliae TaxID=178035 RepID=A0A154NZ36_DUFNO|nr:hypothetical protein WN55_02016 [Dufourea novaeangliae]
MSGVFEQRGRGEGRKKIGSLFMVCDAGNGNGILGTFDRLCFANRISKRACD